MPSANFIFRNGGDNCILVWTFNEQHNYLYCEYQAGVKNGQNFHDEFFGRDSFDFSSSMRLL